MLLARGRNRDLRGVLRGGEGPLRGGVRDACAFHSAAENGDGAVLVFSASDVDGAKYPTHGTDRIVHVQQPTKSPLMTPSGHACGFR